MTPVASLATTRPAAANRSARRVGVVAGTAVRRRLRAAAVQFFHRSFTGPVRNPPRPRRFFHYFAWLDQGHDLPVYPVALFTFAKPRRAERDSYVVSFPDKTVLDVRFTAIQLNRLNWKQFADRDNPIAAALMSKMHIEPKDRPVVKLACVRMMLKLPLKPAHRALVQRFVDSYLRLDVPERKVYEREAAKLPQPEKEKVMAVMNEWAEAALKRGERRGMKRGMQRGMERGTSLFLRALRGTVGDLPATVEQRVRKLPASRLDELADALSTLKSLKDLTAWLDRD